MSMMKADKSKLEGLGLKPMKPFIFTIEHIKEEEVGLIVVPEGVKKDDNFYSEVIYAYEGSELKPGDIIVHGKHGGSWQKMNGEHVRVFKEDEIFGVIEE